MDASARAGLDALAALLALREVDVGEVAAHLDGFERAGLEALLAGYAAYLAVLHRNGAFLSVVAGHIHAAVVLTFGTDLDDAARTSLGTSAAAHAFVFVHLWQTCLLVDVEGVELAFLHTVAQPEAAVRTSVLASVESVGETADVGSFIMHLRRRVLTSTVATHYGNHRLGNGSGQSKQSGHFRHIGAGAVQTGEALLLGGGFNARLREVAASGEAASAAVSARQDSSYEIDARVFFHFEEQADNIQQTSCQ